MRTFAVKRQTPHQSTLASPAIHAQVSVRQRREIDTVLYPRRTITPSEIGGFRHDFSRIPVHAVPSQSVGGGVALGRGAHGLRSSDDDRTQLEVRRRALVGETRTATPAAASGVPAPDPSVSNARAAEAPPEASAPLTIVHETVLPAPDGTANTRTDVGVGEEVVFTGSAAGTWKASAAASVSGIGGGHFAWTAPSRAASVTIELMVGEETVSETMNVVEPDHITGQKEDEISYPAGTQGAGMHLRFSYHPMNVSFGNIATKEVSGPASEIKGYFGTINPQYIGHDADYSSGGEFIAIGLDNKDIKPDEALLDGVKPPWQQSGSFAWDIPNRFRVNSETGDGKEFTRVRQDFFLLGADKDPKLAGTTTITKLGESVKRTP